MSACCSERSLHLHATESFCNLGNQGLARQESIFTESLCDTCSGEDGSDSVDDDTISLCSWTTDYGDWEPSLCPHNPSSGVSELGSEDGDFRLRVETHAMPSQPVDWNSRGVDTDMTNYKVSYLPVFFPVSPMWPTANVAVPHGQAPLPHAEWRVPSKVEELGRKSRTMKPKRQHGQRSQMRMHNEHGRKARSLQCDSVVAASVSQADVSVSGEGDDEQTTLILRNLPREWNRDALLHLLNAEGFGGSYNFVHLPIDFQTKSGLGYALVNVVNQEIADQALQHFNGLQTRTTNGVIIEADWNSPQQGLQAHVERYRNSPLMHESVPEVYRPLLFKNGHQIAFPEPTARVRPPRIRHQKPSVKSNEME